MKILQMFPPNIGQLRKVFPLTSEEIFAWGDIIYSPSSDTLPRWLIEHEKVHKLQQEKLPFLLDDLRTWQEGAGGPKYWWSRYLQEPKWRFEQELEAHWVEYRVFCEDEPDRNRRRVYLKGMARRLSGPMYGRLATFESARRLIKNG